MRCRILQTAIARELPEHRNRTLISELGSFSPNLRAFQVFLPEAVLFPFLFYVLVIKLRF